VSGVIHYFSDAQRLVPDVDVTASGPQTIETTTNAFGAYDLTLPRNTTWTTVASKSGGQSNAITAGDASFILRAVVGLISVDADRLAACDANGSGRLTAIDSTYLLRWRVGLIDRLPASQRCGSDWLFRPLMDSDAETSVWPADVSLAGCTLAQASYHPLSSDRSAQDWAAILIGDCNGSWRPPSGGGGGAAVSGAGLQAGRFQRGRNGVRLPLFASAPLSSLEAVVRYDSSQLAATRVSRSAIVSAATLAVNLTEPGIIRIAMASATDFDSAGQPLLFVYFDRLGNGPLKTPRVEGATE
jgi:hypothetical protein